MTGRFTRIVEVLAVLATVALSLWAADTSLDRALAQAALREGPLLRSLEEVAAAHQRALVAFAAGTLALLGGRLLGQRQQGLQPITLPLLLPATIAAVGLGYAVQTGYGDPLRGPSWPGPDFATGVLLGGGLGGLVLALPIRWEELVDRGRHFLLGGIALAFAGLAAFGTGPAGTRINLLGFQPLELVKLAFVAYVAVFLARRATALRYQRNYLLQGLLRVPRPRLLLPATLVLVGLFLGLFLVRDLGPILILGLTFLVLFTVVTRSVPWAGFAVGLVTALVAAVAAFPEAVGSEAVALRMQMWLDPWTNALPNGDQLAASRWAIAAGGWWGQGVGHALIGGLPAGHTDLVLAHLGEELGFAGVALYHLLLAILVGSGAWVAMENRTPERVLLATGLTTLLAAQWLVIFAGTTGGLPLTGVVVPFLSSGRTSMLVFLLVVSLIGALARDGRARAVTDELRQLRGGVYGMGTIGLLLVGLGVLVWFGESVLLGPATSARGVVTTLADGTVVHRFDRRMEALAALVPRGEIRDRRGAVLAGTDASGRRTYPLGDALGTLLGPASAPVLRPPWGLERSLQALLRGYPDRRDGPSMWLVLTDGGEEELLFVTPTRRARPRDTARAKAQAGDRPFRQVPLPAPDLRPLVPALHAPAAAREAVLVRELGTVEDRSVAVTLDAGLQAKAAEILQGAAARGKAAAAVVIDVDSGQVLARAQVPDFDPGDPDAWLGPVRAGDPAFVGVYGPWSDLTADRGIVQAGSVGKLVTALAAVREGLVEPVAAVGEDSASGCALRSEVTWACRDENARGPYFTRDDWAQPIHDFRRDSPHGTLDLTEALAVSCNVTFAQVALQLGPAPFAGLVRDGLALGWSEDLDPGAADSRRLAETGIGQGAMALSPIQAARLAATIGGGGVYRACPLVLGEACDAQPIVEDRAGLEVVLAGMRRVMTEGTGRGLPPIEGVRVYGKTGTADSIGLRDEEPYGLTFKETGYPPHSWFVALAEPEPTEACGPAERRLAVAVVVPRSGTGAAVAGPAAIEILKEAHRLGYLGEA